MVKDAVQKWALSRVPDREVNNRPDILAAEHLSFQYTKKRRILKDINDRSKNIESARKSLLQHAIRLCNRHNRLLPLA